eukprot:NODE_2518_length_912_cov_94.896871_g2068_i0.p1 GENE.NODE_2518_length_912_cov_94.896871_g2068_i0~~NODE_2518_length_912_cov_94.896871_g2068_i0.p1  ORF type:complete len:228 (-),score=58.29 NODE_2518_length_912_cov_94.896871_g2068_i0:108-791(-)
MPTLETPTGLIPVPPYHSVKEIVDSKKLPAFYQPTWAKTLEVSSKCDDGAVFEAAQREFATGVLDPLLETVDVLVWPTMPVFPPKLGQDATDMDWGSATHPPINMILAGPWSKYATITVPMGFSSPNADAPDGVPIGIIMMSKPNKLGDLFKAAYSYQENHDVSKLPRTTPHIPMATTATPTPHAATPAPQAATAVPTAVPGKSAGSALVALTSMYFIVCSAILFLN